MRSVRIWTNMGSGENEESGEQGTEIYCFCICDRGKGEGEELTPLNNPHKITRQFE